MQLIPASSWAALRQQREPANRLKRNSLTLTAFLLLLGLFMPRTAWGQFHYEYSSGNFTDTQNFSTAVANVINGGRIFLTNNGVLDQAVTIRKNITIDTYTNANNGQLKLSRNSANYYIQISSGYTVTINNIILDGQNLVGSEPLIKVYGTLKMNGRNTSDTGYDYNNCKIINCIKKNSTPTNGSAIHVFGSYGRLVCYGVSFADNENRDVHRVMGGLTYGGGALAFNEGSSFDLRNCYFGRNKAYESGGAILLEYPNDSYIESCIFEDNIAYWGGGALYGLMTNGHKLDIEGTTTFRRNQVLYSTSIGLADPSNMGFGGAACFITRPSTRSEYNIGNRTGSNITFEDNYARCGGGALLFWCDNARSRFRLKNFTMTGNYTDDNGEAEMGIGGALYIHGATTEGHDDEHFEISNGTFRNNHTVDYGGAIYLETHDINVQDVTFESNYTRASNSCGGAVAIFGNESANIHTNQFTKCTFIKNGINGSTTTTATGGALYSIKKTNIKLLGCTVGGSSANANKATGNGGGIFIGSNSYLTLDSYGGTDRAIVSYNRGRHGGGIYVASGSQGHTEIGTASASLPVYIKNNTAEGIDGVESGMGGGIYLNCGGHPADQFTLKYFELTYNTASGIGKGGGAYFKSALVSGEVHDHTALTISNGTVSNNSSYHGAGLYFDHHDAAISNVNFQDHTVFGNGGAVYILGHSVDNDDPHQHDFTSCTFTANSAMNGGAVYVTDNAKAEFDSNSIIGSSSNTNTAYNNGGGIYMDTNCEVELNGTTVTNNIAGNYGGGVYLSTKAILNVTGSVTVYDNESTRSSNNSWSFINGGSNYRDDVCLHELHRQNNGKIKVIGDLAGAKIGITEEPITKGSYRSNDLPGDMIRQFTINYGIWGSGDSKAFVKEVFVSNDTELPVKLLPAENSTTGLLEVTLGLTELIDASKWYVAGIVDDGGFTWGSDDNNSGLYPDLPKRTLTGPNGVFAQPNFDPTTDQIFVVRAISVTKEADVRTTDGKVIIRYPISGFEFNTATPIPDVDGSVEVTLYRYPGGHVLSSAFGDGVYDGGEGDTNYGDLDGHTHAEQPSLTNSTLMPGPNIGPVFSMDDNVHEAVLRNIFMGGMSAYSGVYDAEYNPSQCTISPQSALLSVEANTKPITLKETCEVYGNENKDGGDNSASGKKEQRTGGGIYNAGTLLFEGVYIANNTCATNGGGIYNIGSVQNISSANSITIAGNEANGSGGGIYDNGSQLKFDVLGEKRFFNNMAGNNGGAIWTKGQQNEVTGSTLPAGYTQVEYLQSTSRESYVNTGLTLNTEYTFEVVAQQIAVDHYGCIIWAGDQYGHITTTGCEITVGNRAYYLWSNASGYQPENSGIIMSQPFQVTQNKVGLVLKQGSKTWSVPYSSVPYPAITSTPIVLFGPMPYGNLGVKIYEAKIMEGGAVLRHFVPCKRDADGTLGVMDINNSVNQFYEGFNIIAGDPITPPGSYWADGVVLSDVVIGGSREGQNTASQNGGGIYINTNGTAKVINSTLTFNTANNKGGGVYKLGTLKVEGLMAITNNESGSSKAIVRDNVYVPTAATEKHILISNELICGSSIGVTKTKAEHTYDADDNFTGVRTVIATNETTNSGHALNAFNRNVFFDDTDQYGVWSFNYHKTNAANDYSIENDYFIETWRNYAASSFATANQINSAAELALFAKQVNTGNNYSAATVSQTATIDLDGHYWEPIGFSTGSDCDPITDYFFAGSYNGNGHLILNTNSILPAQTMGLFGRVTGTVKHTFAIGGDLAYTHDGPGSLGAVAGEVSGIIDGCEAADFNLNGYAADASAGGIVGITSGEVRNSFSSGITYEGTVANAGGLAGHITLDGAVRNSYSKADVPSVGTNNGALVGKNEGTLNNVYTSADEGTIVGTGHHGAKVYSAGAGTATATYTAPIGADHLGYMCIDNGVDEFDRTDLIEGKDYFTFKDADGNEVELIPLFRLLSLNAAGLGDGYAEWARPALAYYNNSFNGIERPINGDLPLLMLNNYDGSVIGQGGFRSVGTYGGSGDVLQYGGPDRDGTNNELDAALTRTKKSNFSGDDFLFVYGDVTTSGAPTSAVASFTQAKVSIYEHAAITRAGTLAGFNNTYVGITFDNSGDGKAISTNGMNDLEQQTLPRDWHMLSTPVTNAPLGFNYPGEQNTNKYNGGDYSNDKFYNNPWGNASGTNTPNNPSATEFSWLNNGATGHNRYWMHGWDNSRATGTHDNGSYPANTWQDGYFPSKVNTSAIQFGEQLFIVADGSNGSNEYTADGIHRYPYGMDLYSWSEPKYHYINFKRNGPNHWHSDAPHKHLDYTPETASNNSDADAFGTNVNETILLDGKGYMASIHIPTFLQTSGKLGSDSKKIDVSYTDGAKLCNGWNLVGNPFHAYLDFDALCDDNSDKIADNTYIIYNADAFGKSDNGAYGDGFCYYVAEGSANGAYADKYLHPHQGFFVKKTEGSARATLNFSEGQTKLRKDIGETGSTFRSEERPAYPLVNLFLSSSKGCSDVTVIELNRPEWGGATKMREMYSGNGLFYATHDNNNYAALFATPDVERVPLKFEAKDEAGDTYTLSWNTQNGDFSKLLLVDNFTGVTYDMLRNSSYSFSGKKGDYWSRFYITFDVVGIEEDEQDDDDASTGSASTTFAFFDGSQWVVTNTGQGPATLDLIDLQGRVLDRTVLAEGQARVSLPDVAKGMYLLRMSNDKGSKIQKVIVR